MYTIGVRQAITVEFMFLTNSLREIKNTFTTTQHTVIAIFHFFLSCEMKPCMASIHIGAKLFGYLVNGHLNNIIRGTYIFLHRGMQLKYIFVKSYIE